VTAAAQSPQPVSRPLWRRLIGFNLLTAVLLGVGGYYLGWFIGHQIGSPSFKYEEATDENDVALLLAYFFGVAGFLIGLGFANYPISRLLGRPPSLREKEQQGISRYFGLCTDHKVVGIQYLVGIGLFLFVGALNAMMIRTELLHDTPTFVGPNQYLTLVGVHGAMMMGIMTSGVLGPFANYFVPLMIGARRMAFPRIEALTFWLLMAAGFILVSTIFFGGFPTGWTGYEPLNDQAVMGMDSYICFFALVGISMCLLGLNMIATIITMRGPGLTWSRLPIFVWAVFATSILMVLAAPTLIATLLMAAAAAPTCSRTSSGSSGTPRCTSSRCRASGSCWSCFRCSRASPCGATAWRSRGCSGSRC
jgi:cytochrome c oxidase subunit 1